MRRLQQFCPKCGKNVDELVQGLCGSCYSEGKRLAEVPEQIVVATCPTCGKFYSGGKWVDFEGLRSASKQGSEGDARIAIIADELRVNAPSQIDIQPKGRKIRVIVEGSLEGGVQKHEEYEVSVKEKKRMCDNCALAKGGYYEAVLQIRSEDERNVKRVLGILEEILRRPRGKHWFIQKSVVVKGGVDVYLGGREMLPMISKRVKEEFANAEQKRSNELFGQVQGKEVFRHFLLVRV